MRGRACWAVGVWVLLLCCSTGFVLPPSPTSPGHYCSITCGRGGHLMFQHQHLCAGGGSRFLQDVTVTGRRTERNEDGTLKLDVWVAHEGDYPVANVETMQCSAYVAQLVASRPADKRGRFPGENADGTPAHP